MRTIAKRVVAVALAVIGLVLGAGGVWFATQLGTTGTATFQTRPPDTGAVVLTPSMLGRVDATVTISAAAADDSEVWIGVARPSDAQAAIADGRHREATGVELSGWALTTTTRGSADLAAISRGDVWHEQVTGAGTQSLNLDQANAPETVVISAAEGNIEQVSVSYTRKAWFVQSVLAAIVGGFLVIAGVLLWRLRLGDSPQGAGPATPVPVPAPYEMAPAPARRSSPLSKVPWPGRPAAAGAVESPDVASDTRLGRAHTDSGLPDSDLPDSARPTAADQAPTEDKA